MFVFSSNLHDQSCMAVMESVVIRPERSDLSDGLNLSSLGPFVFFTIFLLFTPPFLPFVLFFLLKLFL